MGRFRKMISNLPTKKEKSMFKKVRICIMVCLLLVTTVISAYGSTGTQYEHNDVSDKSAWTEGLQDGERVIAVFKNTFLDSFLQCRKAWLIV